jgi:uncharacterized RDD family membrane protein YckC
MEFRIGINLGDVMIEDHDIFGEGVNIAARLQGLAPPGGILISGSVYEQVRNKLSASFDFMGLQAVKNIADQVPAYVVAPERPVTAVEAPPPPPPAPPVLRALAGATDAAIACGLVLVIVVPLQAAGAPIANLSMPFGLLASERTVRQSEPTTEIREGGGVVVTRQETFVNRTFLGLATQQIKVTKSQTVRNGVSTASTEEQLVDARSGRALSAPSIFWLFGAAYLALSLFTEGMGAHRRSPGKSLFGLSVHGAKGAPLSAMGGVVRNVAKIASILPFFAGYLLPLLTKKPQALHDMASGARVVQG